MSGCGHHPPNLLAGCGAASLTERSFLQIDRGTMQIFVKTLTGKSDRETLAAAALRVDFGLVSNFI